MKEMEEGEKVIIEEANNENEEEEEKKRKEAERRKKEEEERRKRRRNIIFSIIGGGVLALGIQFHDQITSLFSDDRNPVPTEAPANRPDPTEQPDTLGNSDVVQSVEKDIPPEENADDLRNQMFAWGEKNDTASTGTVHFETVQQQNKKAFDALFTSTRTGYHSKDARRIDELAASIGLSGSEAFDSAIVYIVTNLQGEEIDFGGWDLTTEQQKQLETTGRVKKGDTFVWGGIDMMKI